MTSDADFKHQAKAVRNATQEKLKALRAERLEKLRVARSGRGVADASAPTPGHAQIDPEPQQQGPFAPSEAPSFAVSAEADQLSIEASLTPPVATDADIETPPPDPPSLEEPPSAVDDGVQPSEADSSDELTASIEADEGKPTWDGAESDLADLPGTGPGLVWLLKRHDIHTLSDLSRADPAELTSALGMIGQILDVRQLVEEAKRRSA
ncbi:MAG: hypothetical protein AAGI50_01475 [Pseudomonadota bacterium]